MSTLNTSHTELGGHDALRFGTRSIKAEVLPGHPLEARLDQVRAFTCLSIQILTKQTCIVVGADTVGVKVEFGASSIWYARSY
jgi:hypothetical protein